MQNCKKLYQWEHQTTFNNRLCGKKTLMAWAMLSKRPKMFNEISIISMLKYILYQACSITCDNEHENMHIQLVLNRNWQSSTYMGKKLKILVRGSIHIMILQSVCWWSDVQNFKYWILMVLKSPGMACLQLLTSCTVYSTWLYPHLSISR